MKTDKYLFKNKKGLYVIMKKNSILHLNSNYVGTKLHRIMIEKINKYFNNDIFVPLNKNIVIDEKFGENVYIYRCFGEIDRYFYYKKQKKIIKVLLKNVNVKKYAMIHAHTLFTDGNVAYSLYKKYGIPYVIAVRNTDIDVFFKYRFYLRKRGIDILLNASRIVFLSAASMDRVLSNYVPSEKHNLIENKSKVITNGIDDYWIINKNNFAKRDLNEINIIFVGRVDKNKNLNVVIEAAKILINSGKKVKVSIIGEIIDTSIYKKYISLTWVKFEGKKKKEELLQYYREANIFAVASFRETFGLVYAEAMSQGLPVIYTKNQGFDGQYPDGVIGYAVDPNSPKEIVDKILLILKMYDSISNNCIENTNRYCWNDICLKYKEMYESIILEK